MEMCMMLKKAVWQEHSRDTGECPHQTAEKKWSSGYGMTRVRYKNITALQSGSVTDLQNGFPGVSSVAPRQ